MGCFMRNARLEVEDGLLKITITASNSHGQMDVAQAYENGVQNIRNIEYHGLGGWQFYMPGHKYRSYGYYGSSTYVAEEEPWYKAPSDITSLCKDGLVSYDIRQILELYPDFCYMANKLDLTFSNVFHILNIWLHNQLEFETLVNIGALNCALDGRFYRMKDRKSMIRFLSRNPEWKNVCFEWVRLHMKNGATIEQCKEYNLKCGSRYSHLSYDEWLFTEMNGVHVNEFRDYLKMCKELKKDLKDRYWHFPKNFRKAHQKVVAELHNRREAERIAWMEKQREREEAEAKAEKSKFSKFSRMMRKWAKRVKTTSGIKVWVPQTVSDVIRQADVLSQCLIDCDYIEEVVQKKLMLVFVCDKSGNPLATAELIKKGRKYSLGQFYGDESKDDFQARPEHHKALEAWAKKFNVRIAA